MRDTPFIHQLRIDWSDMDLFGHVNNIAYFRYVQSARVNCWEVTALAPDFAATGIGPILKSCGCVFSKPLHYPGVVVIHSRIEFIKETSFGLFHQLYNEAGELSAEARDVIVMYDFGNHTTIKVPESFRQHFQLPGAIQSD